MIVHDNSDSNPVLLGDLLNRISEFEFVITDTYHVCLNAWRAGVPAICIGETLSLDIYDVSIGWRNAWRDKRQTFYFMYDAMEFYVYKEELLHQQFYKSRLKQLTKLLQSNINQSISENIRNYAKLVEHSFINKIQNLIK